MNNCKKIDKTVEYLTVEEWSIMMEREDLDMYLRQTYDDILQAMEEEIDLTDMTDFELNLIDDPDEREEMRKARDEQLNSKRKEYKKTEK